jgi:hypothetical protein
MKYLLALALILMLPEAQAQSVGIPAIAVDGGSGDGETYSVTLEILALMTMLTLLPAILLMMTSFTRGAGHRANAVQPDYPGPGAVPDPVRHVAGIRPGLPAGGAALPGRIVNGAGCAARRYRAVQDLHAGADP